MVEEHHSLVQLPDYLFVKYFQNEYGLNRGVYNTIDKWFYSEMNQDSIVERRKTIIDFIEYYCDYNQSDTNKFIVGRGNLVNYLEKYSKENKLFSHNYRERKIV